MTCEYLAQQEGVLCEEVLLLSETEDVCVKVKVHARVMGEATVPEFSTGNEKKPAIFYTIVMSILMLVKNHKRFRVKNLHLLRKLPIDATLDL